MTEPKTRYANFPDRDLKVAIGPNLNATTIKTLTRLSIGTYEMSFQQQERGHISADAAKAALTALAKPQGMTVTSEKSREFVGVFTAAGPDLRIQLWITTPFEPGQAAHLVWVKYQELSGEGRTGVAFKLGTTISSDDVGRALKAAQDHAVKLAAGEDFVLKGNPPPRFQKKQPAAPTAETAPATAG